MTSTPVSPHLVLFVSYGNDSIALIQWAHEQHLGGVVCLYSDTGWAAKDWASRVERGEALAAKYGFSTVRTTSVGLPALAQARKGWPRQGMQFCTEHLKIRPALSWLAENDPEEETVCVVGVRREESAARRTFPEWTEQSPRHGGRALWAPLVSLPTETRDKFVRRAGFEVLPYRSKECFPCINSNRADLVQLAADPERIEEINRLEIELGFTSKSKPRTFFRPYRHMGAVGIKEVVRWALADRGQYEPVADCDSGFCGA